MSSSARHSMLGPATRPRLRLAFCLSWYQPRASGAERQAHRQAVELVRRGHRVVVLTRWLSGQAPNETIDGVEVRRVIRPREWGPAFGLTFVGTLALQLLRRRRELDVVHCHQALWEAVAAGWFHRRTGVPTLVQPAAGGEFGEVAILERTKGARWLKPMVQANSHFVAISQQIETELLGLPLDAQRVDRLASGVDTDEFSPGQPVASPGGPQSPPAPRVLFLGRLHPQKNLLVLLEAWKLVQTQRSDAQLLLAGQGPQRDELEEAASRLQVSSSVHFVGSLDEPLGWLRAATVFVLPSLSEGMSNSLLEAMSCGLPVVVSDAGGNVDLVRHNENGLIARASDPAQLAAALVRLLNDSTLRTRLGTAARQHILQHYSLTSLVDRYEQLYYRLHGRLRGARAGSCDTAGTGE